MPKAYSPDLRKRVLEAVAAGATRREAAARFHVGKDTITRWRALERQQGDTRPKPAGGDRRSARIEAERDTVLSLLAENPGLSVEGLRAALDARGLVFSYGAIYRFLRRHGFRRWRHRKWKIPNRKRARTTGASQDGGPPAT